MLHTHASFRGEFSKDREDTDPSGRVLADLIVQHLSGDGLHVTRRDSTDYSHTFDVLADKRRFGATVGLVDDGDREWLFFAESSLGWLPRLFGQRDDAEHLRVLRSAHGALSADPRVSELRWYTEEEWNNNPAGGVVEPAG